tara:strand:+ start:2755 stop:3516 length:762 start_codon:yes stop_codon:yes gene_type:complete
VNRGERNELLIKIFLTELKKKKDRSTVFGEIKSLGFGNSEYKDLDFDIDFNKLNDNDIKSISYKIGISKAPGRSKADIYVNKKGYSIKFLSGGRPSIVNHTARNGWLRIAEELGEDIKKLDKLVSNYWDLRVSKKIAEDCGNNNSLSPFKDHKKILRPYLEYFCFVGTGSSKSQHAAEGVFKFKNFKDPSTWVLYSKSETIDKIWDGLYFCMRGGKGMPNDYENYKYKKIIEPWTRFSSKKHRGAMSVRYESK